MRTVDVYELIDAPMFTSWENMTGKVICKDRMPRERWDLFESSTGVSDEVYDKAAEIFGKRFTELPLLDVQKDDDYQDEDPDFCDLEAALCALELGVTLVKLPDTMKSPYWRLYAVGPLPNPWARINDAREEHERREDHQAADQVA